VRATKISRAWQEQKQVKAIMLFLQSHGVTSGLAARIYQRYGDAAAGVLRDDPYRLATDLHGVGFLTADRIARSLGIPVDSPRRIEAGILHALSELASSGHVCAPESCLLKEAARHLDVDKGAIAPVVGELIRRSMLSAETLDAAEVPDWPGDCHAIYLPDLYAAETGVAWRLRELLASDETRLGSFGAVDWGVAMQWLGARLPYALAEEQQKAIIAALTSKVSVATGGPGTGKTTALRGLITLLQARDASVALAAPTGRAAKRMEEAVGLPAKTIHRLLEVQPSQGFKFARDELFPIDADMVIVDEASMIDCQLMDALTRALDRASHLLLVGDADQLPSVGPGNVLCDLISSGAIPVTRLERVFRQASRSLIVANAHRINTGEIPVLAKGEGDFFLFGATDQKRAADTVVDVVVNRIPAKFGLDSVDDIQVLSPMHRGAAGVRELNSRLQEALNPATDQRAEARVAGATLREGDKVMQVRNNYARDVYNGDLGRVLAIDAVEQTVGVSFDGRLVEYDVGDLDELVLAYACSIHKSQGAEYPAVVMALLPSHYVMLQRNLLYTGVTRARRLCVIVGSRKAISMAVANDEVAGRYSLLSHRLAGTLPAVV
jgi:exodeoxyribonuclease V alpha subunit